MLFTYPIIAPARTPSRLHVGDVTGAFSAVAALYAAAAVVWLIVRIAV